MCLALLVLGLPASAQVNTEQFRKDLSQLASQPRVIGTPGYYAAADYIQAQLGEMPGVQVKTHEYEVMMPVTESAAIQVPGAGEVPVYPFWPAHTRLNATPAEGISGRLVYVGKAAIEAIRPQALDGQIAVVDASSGDAWQRAAYFGARAIIVLGEKDLSNADLRAHELLIPVNIPRFYLPAGAMADHIRDGKLGGPVTLKAVVNWKVQRALNIYALIPAAAKSDKPNPAVVLSVPFDSMALVPDLATGAGQAVQTAFGLATVRGFADRPISRPVLVFFGGGDSIQFLATRQMMMAMADVPAQWDREIASLSAQLGAMQADLERLGQIQKDPLGINVRADSKTLDRVVKIIETRAAADQDELFRLRMLPKAELNDSTREQIRTREDRVATLSQLRYAFASQPAELVTVPFRDMAQDYLAQTIDRLNGSHQGKAGLIQDAQRRIERLHTRVELYRWMAAATGRNPNPDERTNNSRVLGMMIAVDLSDGGVRFGPMYWGWHQQNSNISSLLNYRDWFNRVREEAAQDNTHWYAGVKNVFDVEPISGLRAPQSWLCASMAIGTELCPAWGVPGFSMVTLDDLRSRRDTPADTLAALNLPVIQRQADALAVLLRKAWDDPTFRDPEELKWARNTITGQVVSPAPGRPVPDLPREGFLVSWRYSWGQNKIPSIRAVPYTMGLRHDEIAACGPAGNYRFEGLPRLGQGETRCANIQAFNILAGTGQIVACTDLGRQTAGIQQTADLQTDLDPMRSLVFNCKEASLVGLTDPRYLQDLGDMLPLDARRNAEPQRYNVSAMKQMMCGFFEPDMRAYLVFRYGRVGNRLVLLNTGAPGEATKSRANDEIPGDGYRVAQLNGIGSLALATARDFYNLDDIRLHKYRKAGVSSQLIDSMHAEALGQLERARTAYQDNSAVQMVREANGAWANEARVYSATQDMANDVIRAAIFLLLLCVPFSFCMERLLIGTANIYKQIAGTVGIFSVMAAAMWTFHPAFQISSSPMIIILSFVIIFMSVVVISVVYGKFDTELKRIRSGRGSSETASFARASVLMSAVLLGIANMRRRKFRTVLTSITIVLITFAVLCFTSASIYLDTVTLPTGVMPSHSGIMLRQRGWRAMPESAVDNLRAILGQKQLVRRWWNANAADPRDMVHLVVPSADGTAAKVLPVQAVLGLSPGESSLWPRGSSPSPIAQILGAEDFARLERGERNIIYLSDSMAGELGLKKGQSVLVGGISLEVAGVFDATAFDRGVNLLSGEPLAPLKYSTGMMDSGGRKLDDQNMESLELGGDSSASELQSSYEHLSATQFVIVPEAISRQLPNASLRSLAFRLEPVASDLALLRLASLRERAEAEEIPGSEQMEKPALIQALADRAARGQLREPTALSDALVKDVSDELSRRFAIAIFAGFGEGVKMVAASNLSSVSGAGQVAIPLAIAGLIIFNTMMGSIAERRREIHVYTSLGLAPVHVAALFLAEAMTYGLIGAVFGYVIGQGVGTLMMHMGWLGGVTLNYSGSSAMMTLGLILLIVLFSALVPARLASRIAAPSIDRTWRVPQPKDGRIIAQLPFTINKTAAEGALAYLAEFFDAHQEGSIGKFSSGKIETFVFEDESKRQSRGIKTVIWLTPFDLGVRQHLMLLIHPGQFEDIHEVQVILERLSGDDSSWYRMNRAFLTELRKQFLQWRSLTPQRMLEYVEESRKLFEQTSGELVKTLPGESVRRG